MYIHGILTLHMHLYYLYYVIVWKGVGTSVLSYTKYGYSWPIVNIVIIIIVMPS